MSVRDLDDVTPAWMWRSIVDSASSTFSYITWTNNDKLKAREPL